MKRWKLTGFSLPLVGGGISWEHAPDNERRVVEQLIPFLEDRRVLYNPMEVEIPQHCVESIIRIRQFLVDRAGELKVDNELAVTLRAMAAICRRFLDTVGPRFAPGSYPLGVDDVMLNQGLGELRASIGIHLARVASHYGLQLTEPLSRLLPPEPEQPG